MKGGIGQLMKQAQQMQEKMQKAQEELQNIIVHGESGGGMVKISITCKNEIKKIDNLDIRIRTSIAAFHGYNFLLARENLTDHLPMEQRKNKTRQKLLKIRAKKVITATGSLERPLIFDNNDRPGILLSSAIKRYADLFGVACGEKNIFLTNNDSAYETAISLIQKGIKVEAIVDNLSLIHI